MSKNTALVIYVLAMIVIVVGADLIFFRHRFLARLVANIIIVFLFVVFYFRFMNNP